MKNHERDEVISNYWLDFFATKLCTLCGNSSIIDTRATAITAAGVNAGRLNWCICPNGQAARGRNEGLMPTEEQYQRLRS